VTLSEEWEYRLTVLAFLLLFPGAYALRRVWQGGSWAEFRIYVIRYAATLLACGFAADRAKAAAWGAAAFWFVLAAITIPPGPATVPSEEKEEP